MRRTTQGMAPLTGHIGWIAHTDLA